MRVRPIDRDRIRDPSVERQEERKNKHERKEETKKTKTKQVINSSVQK